MKNQIEMKLNIPKQKNNIKYVIQKWRNSLQKYCDNQALNKGDTTGEFVCGYMSFCDYCKHLGEKNACVKAICELCEEKHILIDIYDYDFEKFIEEIEGNNE